VTAHPGIIFPAPEVEACARVAHEANRAYCIAFMNDHSQPPWDDAPMWQKQSAWNGVKGALAGNTPEQSHECWLEEKRATGWKYGAVKDPDKKEHPCFVPYAELPPDQQRKDRLFLDIVRIMGSVLGIWPAPQACTATTGTVMP
jgi:hypothetical protein